MRPVIAVSCAPGHPPVGHFLCPVCGLGYSRTGPDKTESDRFRIGRLERFGPVWLAVLDREWADAAVNLREAGRRLGVAPKTVQAQAALRGLPRQKPGSRARPLKPKAASAAAARRADMAILRRQLWLKAIAAPGVVGTWAVRATAPATYAWLYCHDREWLFTHLPTRKVRRPCKPRVDWSARDPQIARAVTREAQRMRENPDRPRWITRTSLARRSGHWSLIAQHRDKLPETESVLMALVETREGFALRRLAWAASTYQAEGQIPARWQLIERGALGKALSS